MAHVKAGGTTKGNRDSVSKRLGVKRFGGEKVIPGNILVRQKGTKVYNGSGAKIGKDFTIFSAKAGKVYFYQRLGKLFIGVS